MVDVLEIHVLDVGCADAILIIRANGYGYEHVTLIDGGNAGDGPLVERAIQAFTRSGAVDLLVNTHPDADHLGGLFHVIDRVTVRRVIMHDPLPALRALEGPGVASLLVDDITTPLERAMDFASRVDRSLITRRTGPVDGEWVAPHVRVLGPTPEFYASTILQSPLDLFLRSVDRGGASLSEVLDAKDDVRPLNQSGVIAAVCFAGRTFLFTGDANVTALKDVTCRWDLRGLFWLQIPHHGSKRNLSSDLIRTFSPAVAVVSAPPGDRKHPSRAVLNAFEKVGTPVYGTRGLSLCYRSDGRVRRGYGPVLPMNRPRPRLAPALHTTR